MLRLSILSLPYSHHVSPVVPLVCAEIDSMLATGVIEPSVSPWSSPIIPVKKKDGSIICLHRFQMFECCNGMPSIDEIIDCLGHALYLSKLDLAKGFHQVPIKLEDQPKTAFVTPWSKYQCRYMAFGLRNGPSTVDGYRFT